jgi:hypothetical protein
MQATRLKRNLNASSRELKENGLTSQLADGGTNGRRNPKMKKLFVTALALIFLALSSQTFGQSGNSTISGTITDPTGSVVQGATVTATNAGTNRVLTGKSNNVGIYSFPSVQPGIYKVSAEMKGFKMRTVTNVQIGNAVQFRLNFSLEVGQIAESIEVNAEGSRALMESSSSVGDVLPEQKVRELPLVNQNALDLTKVMAGANVTSDPINGESFGYGGGSTTFAGVSAANINVQRDGVPVGDVRYPTGINSATRLNPDLIGEVRLILSPIDAESGRGNGQVLVQTKSGTANFHGSAVLNSQNSFMDPNTWSNNRSGTTPPWRNLQEYTLSLGGPIPATKDKTFFFVLWDGQVSRRRTPRYSATLTPCAQKGIFRYFNGWNNGNLLQVQSTDTISVVNKDGSPKPPPGDTAGLQAISVFGGTVTNASTMSNDCSDAVIAQGAAWDTYRTGMDPTGYIANFIQAMPSVNNYEAGDGLNTAAYLWNQTIKGADNMYGVGEDTQRKQINFRIDHNFNAQHRLSGSYTYESDWADDTIANWPANSYGGVNIRHPQVFTVNFISTLSPSLLNEARVGMSRTAGNQESAFRNPDNGNKLNPFMPLVNGIRFIVGPGSGNANFGPEGSGSGFPSNPVGTRGGLPADGFDVSPRWTYSDTLSWIKGAHSFKFGGEYRWSGSYGAAGWTTNSSFTSFLPTPYAMGGSSLPNPFTSVSGLAGTAYFGAGTGNLNTAAGLLNFLSGSISQMRQYNYINSPNQTAWSDQAKDPFPIRDFHQNEWSYFFKDDWKVHQDLTLNLGLRWDYYGVPYIKGGMTAGFEGGGNALFGISGRNWDQAFWAPGARADLTKVIFIGPDSPHPDQSVYNKDWNNFGPAVGFAWQIPWLGKGKTALRGGYQLSYMPSGRVMNMTDTLGLPPGSSYQNIYSAGGANPAYLDLTSLVAPVPVPSATTPMSTIPLTDRLSSISAFDPNLKTPYIHNITLSLTHNITPNLEVNVRYVGTISRELVGTININQPNFLTNGLLEAFNTARMGGESPLLDNLLVGLTGGTSGAAFLRSTATYNTFIADLFDYNTTGSALANGNYVVLANKLNYLGSNTDPSHGGLLRASGYPENFIKTNPQFNSANYLTNSDRSNYHSMQAQVTLRPVHGVSLQATYTWAKNLGLTGNPTDPRNRDADYTLLGSDRRHVFVTYGTFDLPFGPKRALGGNSHGALARILENWQGSWIFNASTGLPWTLVTSGFLGGNDMLYGNGVPDFVGPLSFDAFKNTVGVSWKDGAAAGNYFRDLYTQVPDPQCSIIDPSLQSACTLKAIALKSDPTQIIFQNPQPGHQGSLGRNRINMPGNYNIDMALSKAVRIKEGVNLQLRIDAANLLNHPMASFGQWPSGVRVIDIIPPNTNINDTSNVFGLLSDKVGTRTFQLTGRVNF